MLQGRASFRQGIRKYFTKIAAARTDTDTKHVPKTGCEELGKSLLQRGACFSYHAALII